MGGKYILFIADTLNSWKKASRRSLCKLYFGEGEDSQLTEMLFSCTGSWRVKTRYCYFISVLIPKIDVVVNSLLDRNQVVRENGRKVVTHFLRFSAEEKTAAHQ